MVTYAKKGGVLESHKDVPDEIQEELYMEEQQRLEKEKRKGGNIASLGTPYPPININVLLSHPTRVDIIALTVSSAESKDVSLLKIPGFRDVTIKEYSEWLISNVSDETLKATF